MKSRTKKILAVLGVIVIAYMAAYFLSVTTTYAPIKVAYIAVPVYRPFDAPIVHTLFAPAQLLDATYLRPSRWQEKMR